MATLSTYPVLTPEFYSTHSDDTALQQFFANVSGTRGRLQGRKYHITRLISAALSDCEIVGVPGETVITGSFGYALLELLDISNVHFYGIEFNSTHASATEDTGHSIVYSYQHSVTNSSFRRCRFTNTNSNTSALTFYARITAGDTSGTIDGLWVEDCVFENVGRIACTIMNRNTSAYSAAQRVYFNRNHGKNLGTQGSYGFLVSFDGYGQHFTCNGNLVDTALTIGIENTNWCNGEFIGNRFAGFSHTYAPMSFSGTSSRLTVTGNQCLEQANNGTNFIGVSDSRFSANFWWSSGAYAFHHRGGSGNFFDADVYKSSGTNAALIGNASATTTANKWRDCVADTSPSAGAGTAAIKFTGAGTTVNSFIDGTRTPKSGATIWEEVSSASGNTVVISSTTAAPTS